MFGLALLFVYVFRLSFYHFDHIAWGNGSWSLCLSCICLLAMHTLICVTFSLPPGVRVGCDFCLCLFLDVSVYRLVRHSTTIVRLCTIQCDFCTSYNIRVRATEQ